MQRIILSIVCLFVLVPTVSAAQYPQVTLNITGGVSGSIVIELYPDKAPITVANFINYVKSGFYNGLIFHRVIAGFMVQGGGFDQSMVQKATNPPIINESSNGLTNLKYTVAMARTSDPASATAQFFVNVVDNAFLNYGSVAWNGGEPYVKVGYCVFGKVISGTNVVDAIAAVAVKDTTNYVPVTNVIIQSATVTLNGPVCTTRLAGDLDGDCKVTLKDFALMARNWLACNSILPTCN